MIVDSFVTPVKQNMFVTSLDRTMLYLHVHAI